MKQQDAIQIFEDKKVRTIWDGEQEKWYFSVIDIVMTLTDSSIPRRYWSDLKNKLKTEGSQVYEKIVQLKLPSPEDHSRPLWLIYARTSLKSPSPKLQPINLITFF